MKRKISQIQIITYMKTSAANLSKNHDLDEKEHRQKSSPPKHAVQIAEGTLLRSDMTETRRQNAMERHC